MQVLLGGRWKGCWKRSRVSGWKISGWLLTVNSEADTNWFIRKSTKLDTQWVTDFLPIQGNQQISHSGNMPFNTSMTGIMPGRGLWESHSALLHGPGLAAGLLASLCRHALFVFFCFFYKNLCFIDCFSGGKAVARGRHFITQGSFESYILLGDIFSRSLPGISVQRLLLFGPRRRGAGCNLCIFFSS